MRIRNWLVVMNKMKASDELNEEQIRQLNDVFVFVECVSLLTVNRFVSDDFRFGECIQCVPQVASVSPLVSFLSLLCKHIPYYNDSNREKERVRERERESNK